MKTLVFKKNFLVCFFMLTCGLLKAQHAATEEKESLKNSHQLTLALGHTLVAEGVQGGKKQWLPLASWSLNYAYWISDRWAIGLENDWVLESFIIEDPEGELIERKNPISVVPVGIYKPGKHWSYIGGVGVEFAKEQNIMLTRIGIEYGVHLPKHWEVGVSVLWDGKWNYYNSWGLAFTVSKLWSKKHH